MPLPTENQYIDIHTHTVWNYPYIFSIRSLVKPGEPEGYASCTGPASVGLHPWYILEDNKDEIIAVVRAAASLPHVIAIGECGIDLKKEIPVDMQEQVFRDQAEIALSVNKPLIIHCVKAYHKLTDLLKQIEPSTPWIFHGFNQHEEVAVELTGLGAYLSVGSDLLKENARIRKTILSIPPERLFLETDDWQQPVWKLYGEVSRLLGIPEKELKRQLYLNFMECFRSKTEEK